MNLQVGLFRDLLLDMGGKGWSSLEGEQAKGEDGYCGSSYQDLTAIEKEIEELNLRHFTHIIFICRCLSEETIVGNGQLVCLYLLARLMQSELKKCLRLVTNLPMINMDKYFGVCK